MSETVKMDGEHKRRRRELYIILAVIPLIVLLVYLESHLSLVSGDVPVAPNILVLGLININIILVVVLIFLVLRNTVKLFFESKSKLMGSKLRTKLVSAFVILSIVPAVLLFFIAISFINRSIDGWFNIKIEDSLEESLELAQNYYLNLQEKTRAAAGDLALSIGPRELIFDRDGLKEVVGVEVEGKDSSTIEVFSMQGERIVQSMSNSLNPGLVPGVGPEAVADALDGVSSSFVETLKQGDVVRGMAPVYSEAEGGVVGAVVVSYYVPRSIIAKMKGISMAFEDYKQLKLLKNPVKATYFMILLIITALIVFFSIWIGRYIARDITIPIHELAEGTHAVASGNLDYKINVKSNDEVGLLVRSFNRMTEDLKSGKSRLEAANLELRSTNIELEQRRRYVEIVLGNVPAGVVSIDRTGSITAINRVAAEILGVAEGRALGRNYKEVLRTEDRELLSGMVKDMNDLGAESVERQMRVTVRDKSMTVLVNLTALRDENNDYLGMVAVLDDLTHLLKTQRMFAWKEVARRIAHEIKNPLTPIKLSAQRLRKKYLDKFPDDENIFDECTGTIIRQVEELRILVNEFSSFARMPAADPTLNDLNEVVEETMALYKGGHKKIRFTSSVDPNLPSFDIDRDQIKRVIINLMDNAIASIEGEGEVRVETRLDDERKLAYLEVVDTGCGIPEDYKGRLFEPYFSTKKSGTGLGLAIVSNIVSDHNAYIRVRDNRPAGTRFSIEFPIKGVTV